MSASDAVILLVADGLVAVGRVLGRVRRLSGAEVRARQVGDADRLAVAEERREVWAAGELEKLWELPPDPASDMTPEAWGFVGKCPNQGRMCNCTGECITPRKLDGSQLGERSAAVSRPAADNTTQADHLENAWHYHKGAVGYAAMRAGGVEWFCEGCGWSGPTKQAHARHRFQVLADMTATTTRVQEQLGGGA